jgi:serine protease Do
LKTPHYRPGEWNAIKVRIETNRIVAYVNGGMVLESTDTGRRGGKVGLAKFRDTKAQFKDFRVGTSLPDLPSASPSADELAALARQVESVAGTSDAEMLQTLKGKAASSRSVLLERAATLDKQARQLRRVASALHARDVESALVSALRGPEEKVDLFHAALLVAKLDNPELDTGAYGAELAQMTEELKAKAAAAGDETGKVAALTKFLFTEQGFHGSRTDYYNRANSYINEVMDDREGLPITLAVLYLELARQIGLTNLVGVPVPTHFMVGFAPASGREQFIDVFNNGTVLTRSQAVELVAENVDGIGDEDFRPARKREIITRMLHNLLGVAQRNGSASDALRYLDVIVALNPESATDRFNRARLNVQRGENDAAKMDLKWLLDRAPAGLDLERLSELYRSL